ncbi:hypothetical protein RUM44_001944 [Polyplax serrata]|uniref:WH2 domain-containing protein n=1 Tax=Polyplax serrata TaxID=468196 RepID=A0ABR1ALH1_POLSC
MLKWKWKQNGVKRERLKRKEKGKLNEVLELDKTLGDYKLQELSLVSKGNRTVTGLMSSADMINVKLSKHRQNSVCDSSLSSGSFGSRSGSPVPAINVVTTVPQPPIRKKRRPAPKPPNFSEKEKKDRNFGSVLISHSRESSDSSGYHEASVLSESPTHGGPVCSDSPPDTLPRRSKLPASQSFTNLTSIQPAPKGRLISSVSNTSLNSTGYSRKKRAPPPPQTQQVKDDRVKSSTLPSSIAEEMRNGFSFMTESFTSAKVDEDDDIPEESFDNAKVQIPVEVTSRVVIETKATVEEPAVRADVDIKVPPKPKPRRSIGHLTRPVGTPVGNSNSAKRPISVDVSVGAFCPVNHASPIQRSNLTDLTKEKTVDGSVKMETPPFDKSPISRIERSTKYPELSRRSKGYSLCDNFISDNPAIGQSTLFFGKPDSEEKVSPIENADQTDHDSINWEYQLPPPPTDFRDTNSPNCTEFGTITITPEVLENVESYRKPDVDDKRAKKSEQIDRSINFKSSQLISEAIQSRRTEIESNHHNQPRQQHNEPIPSKHQEQENRPSSERKLPQHKSDVMCELTNILSESRKQKEKSLSVSNLYINDPVVEPKRTGLNYSRSFSTEKVSSLKNFKFVAGMNGDEWGNNRKLSYANERDDDNEIKYRNNKNLEKSSSMECIDGSKLENGNHMVIGRAEDVFRKPVAPVQKKLKIARRSASTLGVNTVLTKKRNNVENGNENCIDDSWSDDPNINVLKQQFLEFLKEKKLMNSDLKVNSLDVICNILPEVVGNHSESKENEESNVEDFSQGKNAHFESVEEMKRPKVETVKVVDVKVKSPVVTNGTVTTEVKPVLMRHESVCDGDVARRENNLKPPQEKKQDLAKRYSYQGPPSINFGTWGERPKTTRIIIKDEDYVTQAKLKEKKMEAEAVKSAVKPPVQPTTVPVMQKPTEPVKEVKKPQIVIKKPGVLSHYEMFSALPKRKEISSLKMIFMEEEERRRLSQEEEKIKKLNQEEEERKRHSQTTQEPRDSHRVPVVCGIEFKKEFKEVEMPLRLSTFHAVPPSTPPPPPPVVTEEPIKTRNSISSLYRNGNSEDKSIGSKSNFIIPKRNSSLAPVVKGFRSLEESQGSKNLNGNLNGNHIFYGDSSRSEVNEFHQKRSPVKTVEAVVPSPPLPPVISAIKLKSTSTLPAKTKVKVTNVCSDPRSQLLDEIRNFGGLRKLNKAVVH